MIRKFHVSLNERVVVLRDGLPIRALGPGRHTVWGARLSHVRFDTDTLLFETWPEIRAVLPDEWYREVRLGDRQRGVLYRDGSPRVFLRPGVHRFWVVDPSVELRVMSVDEPTPEMTDELFALIPRSELVYTLVHEHQRGLQYVQGRFERVLEPGRYALWSHPEAQVDIDVIDMRRQQLQLTGQELMTRDKVTLRLSLSVEHAVEDPAKVAHAVADARDAVYLIVQLAARDWVAGVTLDELLESRDAMTRYLEEHAVPKAASFGVRVDRVGVKDVVLPGDMKGLLNRVIEADKEAAANTILRREETASTRQMANTAKVMGQHPVLLRLKELEAMKEIAERIDEVRLVVGSEGLQNLTAAQLLKDGSKSHDDES